MYAFVGFLSKSWKASDGSGARGKTWYKEEVWSHIELLTNMHKNMMVTTALLFLCLLGVVDNTSWMLLLVLLLEVRKLGMEEVEAEGGDMVYMKEVWNNMELLTNIYIRR